MVQFLSERDDGHNWGRPHLNSAGIVYTTFITAYTALVIYGLVTLWKHRRETAVHIRSFPITCAAVLAIHVYVAALFIVYPLNGWYKCGTEFWYMSIIFPLGIALFQASNVRLLSYAKTQHELIDLKCWAEKKQPLKWNVSDLQARLKKTNYVNKTYFWIAVGLAIQFIFTFVLFFGSRRFSPSIGFFGTHVNDSECRRGAEWVPSVAWQFIWTWVLGPLVLFRTRNIKDTHYWALQTRLAVLAGLPGTPLWVAFLYSRSSKIVQLNAWWPPAMWFAPGLIMMQVTSIGIPLYDIWRRHKAKRPSSSTSLSLSEATTLNSMTSSSIRKSKELACSWEAFEFQLRHNIQPLFFFAATRDFTAENIQFLREVRDFKRNWRRQLACPPAGGLVLNAEEQRNMFEDAARIYFELACSSTSRCNINVDSKIYGALDQMFSSVDYETPADSGYSRSMQSNGCGREPSRKGSSSSKKRDQASVAPWESPALSAVERSGSSAGSDVDLYDLTIDPDQKKVVARPPPAARPAFSGLVATSASSATEHEQDSRGALRPQVSYDLRSSSYTQSHPDSAYHSQRGRIVARHLESDDSNSSTSVTSIPATFSLRVFDKAEDSIKYLVYTNTWKSFVGGMSEESVASLTLDASSRGSVTNSLFIEPGVGGRSAKLRDMQMYEVDIETQTETDEAEADAMHARARGLGMDGAWSSTGQSIGESWIYRGVLDVAGSETTLAVDSRCAGCRRKQEARNAAKIAHQSVTEVKEHI